MTALFGTSSYAAKKTPVWQDVMDMMTDCVTYDDLEAAEEKIAAMRSQLPASWDESLNDIIAARREEIRQEDISEILRDRFDF